MKHFVYIITIMLGFIPFAEAQEGTQYQRLKIENRARMIEHSQQKAIGNKVYHHVDEQQFRREVDQQARTANRDAPIRIASPVIDARGEPGQPVREVHVLVENDRDTTIDQPNHQRGDRVVEIASPLILVDNLLQSLEIHIIIDLERFTVK